MSAEANRQIVLKYFKLMHERNKPFAEELLSEDCRWWAPGCGIMDKAASAWCKNTVTASTPPMC